MWASSDSGTDTQGYIMAGVSSAYFVVLVYYQPYTVYWRNLEEVLTVALNVASLAVVAEAKGDADEETSDVVMVLQMAVLAMKAVPHFIAFLMTLFGKLFAIVYIGTQIKKVFLAMKKSREKKAEGTGEKKEGPKRDWNMFVTEFRKSVAQEFAYVRNFRTMDFSSYDIAGKEEGHLGMELAEAPSVREGWSAGTNGEGSGEKEVYPPSMMAVAEEVSSGDKGAERRERKERRESRGSGERKSKSREKKEGRTAATRAITAVSDEAGDHRTMSWAKSQHAGSPAPRQHEPVPNMVQ
eukprot:Rmarinus@m.4054